MKNFEKSYSLHRYLNKNGAPDLDKIFSEIESPLRRHLDSGLKGIWKNQPDDVVEVVDKHLIDCEKCRIKFLENGEKQGELELDTP